MNLEHGHETYFHHGNDWNYHKLMNLHEYIGPVLCFKSDVISIANQLHKDVLYARKQYEDNGAYFRHLTESLDPAQVAEWNNWPRKASVLQIMDVEEAETCSNETVTINDTSVSAGKEEMVDNDQGCSIEDCKKEEMYACHEEEGQ